MTTHLLVIDADGASQRAHSFVFLTLTDKMLWTLFNAAPHQMASREHFRDRLALGAAARVKRTGRLPDVEGHQASSSARMTYLFAATSLFSEPRHMVAKKRRGGSTRRPRAHGSLQTTLLARWRRYEHH